MTAEIIRLLRVFASRVQQSVALKCIHTPDLHIDPRNSLIPISGIIFEAVKPLIQYITMLADNNVALALQAEEKKCFFFRLLSTDSF